MTSSIKREPAHGCTMCGEVGRGFMEAKTGRRICNECGGHVLTLQEAFDKIADLRAEIDALLGEADAQWLDSLH